MPQIEWTPEMSVGHDILDQQHRVLLDLVNDLDTAGQQGKGQAAVAGLLEDLLNYTSEHFAAEEAVLVEHGYEHLAKHRAQHRELVTALVGFRRDLASGRAFLADFRIFLASWLEGHIMGDDRDYGRRLFGVDGAMGAFD
jgi:hemerythrin